MKIIYRFHDKDNQKVKEPYINKIDTFYHFFKIFNNGINDIYVVADNIDDSSYEILKKTLDISKIIRTSWGNSHSFLFAVYFAIINFDSNDIVYLSEDDYIYTQNASQILEEGVAISDYVSGYDHPDKYVNHNEGGPNPFIKEGGEETRVLISKSHHWKLTNSCCMTFATKVKFLKEDFNIYKKYCYNNYPLDFDMWRDLITNSKRKLISAIPGVSTHGETYNLSPFVNWKQEYVNSFT
jgi:hypothetical protein